MFVSSGFICGLYIGGMLVVEVVGLFVGYFGVEVDDIYYYGMMLDVDDYQIIDLGDDFYIVGCFYLMIDLVLCNQLIVDFGVKL